MMSKAEKRRHDEYEAEEDLRTLSRAEEIRGDRGRLTRAQKMHRKQARSMSRVGRAIGASRR